MTVENPHLVALKAFGLEPADCILTKLSAGLINTTWKVSTASCSYILQKINESIFNDPIKISENIQVIGGFLKKSAPQYKFLNTLADKDGKHLVSAEGIGAFRLFPFVEASITHLTVNTAEQAYEAAAQFGQFTNLLSKLDATKLNITIPNFHNLTLRHKQFLYAVENGNTDRIMENKNLIEGLLQFTDIAKQYEIICASEDFKLRVTHHDTKISNVLFDKNDKGICIIDLDTVMPGYFISDVGDMMRTYLCPVSEEESDLSKITVREEYYKAIQLGYLHFMKDELTDLEKEHFFYAGAYMIYMQSLRFMTDYLNNDIYYTIQYPTHNLVRAANQYELLLRYKEKEKLFNSLA